MGIVDFFRPKYRHSDVRVRLEAVRALTSDEGDILASVARTDKDPDVRRVAIEKLDEVDVLAEIAERDADRGLRDLAGSRAAEMWVTSACQDEDAALAQAALSGLLKLGDQVALAEVAVRAGDKTIRARAIGEIREPRALAELARETSSPEVRQQAVARIADAEALRSLAMDATLKELGLLAVERVDDKDALEQLAHRAKVKAVRQRARRKLDEIAEAAEAKRPRESDEQRRRRAEKSQLARTVESLGETFEWQKSLETVRGAEAAWAALGDSGDAALDERFARAVARYHARRDAAERQTHEREEAAIEARARRDAEAPAVEPRAPRPRDDDDGDIVNPNAAAALRPADDKRAAREREAVERREQRERERSEEQARRERDVAERESRQKEAQERGAQIARSLEALVDEMATLLEASDAKAIDRILGQAATGFGQLGKVSPAQREPLEDRYGEVRAKLVIRLKDLREGEDWKRWANVPRAEALIAAARLLAEGEDQPTLPILQELQKRWKEVGAIPQNKSKELWEQFKGATDAAFARIRSTRDAENAKLADNLKIKEQLVAQAEALADSTDWDATAQALKALQRQWKESGPAPRRQADDLWKKFRAACDRFFERRKPLLDEQMAELRQNLERKEQVIRAVEGLVARTSGDQGWGKAIAEVKAAQREWKEIGRVPRADVEPLWQRFRAACDALFAKRDAARDAEADARRAALESLRVDIEAVLAGGEDVVTRALAVRRTLGEMIDGDVEPSIELRGLYERMLRKVLLEHTAALHGTELDPVAMANRRGKLLARAEALLPRELPAVSADASPAEVAERLRKAFAQNALFKGDGRDAYEVIEELRIEWRSVGPVVGDEAEAVSARFEEVCGRVVGAHGAERVHQDDASRGSESHDGQDRRERRRERRGRRQAEAAAAEVPIAELPSAAVQDPVSATPLAPRDEHEVSATGQAGVAEEVPATGQPEVAEEVSATRRADAATEVSATRLAAEEVSANRPAAGAATETVSATQSEVAASPTATGAEATASVGPRKARARTSTLPPGVVEKMDDEWGNEPADPDRSATAAPGAAPPSDAPGAPPETDAVDSGWE